MDKPYLKKLGTFKGFDIWYVDGPWIRKNINNNFTNFGYHYNFDFIPSAEIWIDEEHGKKEWKIFVKSVLARIKCMKSGKEHDEAIRFCNIVEQKERDKSKIVQKLKSIEDKKEIIKKIHKKLLKEYSSKKIKVWVVRGNLVRSLFFIDFTEGGHEKVYDFIPSAEIWIDDALSPSDVEFVLLHESYERNLMKNAMSYDNAHEKANEIEVYARNHDSETGKLLKKELEKSE